MEQFQVATTCATSTPTTSTDHQQVAIMQSIPATAVQVSGTQVGSQGQPQVGDVLIKFELAFLCGGVGTYILNLILRLGV